MRKMLVAAAAVVVLGTTAAAMVPRTSLDWCPPLIECFQDEGTLFVRNQRAEPIRVRFEKAGTESTFEVAAHAQGAYTDLPCHAARIVVLDTAGTQIGRIDGPFCANRTWTFDASGGVTLTDGVPQG